MRSDWDSLASSSRAQPRDLYFTAGISVYAPYHHPEPINLKFESKDE